jgi:fibronectin-binding autotransporter adhesin
MSVNDVFAAVGNDTWTTGTGDGTGNFSSSTNWTGANTPPQSGDALIFGATTGTKTLTDNLMTPGTYTISTMTFTSSAPAYTINPGSSSNGVTLSGSVAVVSSSTATETINDNIVLTSGAHYASMNGGGAIVLGGNISGSGAQIVTGGTGELILSGSNSISGVSQGVAGSTANVNVSLSINTNTVVLASSTAAGTGFIYFNNTSGALTAASGGATIANNVSEGNFNITFGAGGNLVDTGTFMAGGSNSIITNNNTTFNQFDIRDTSASTRAITFAGTGTFTVSGLLDNGISGATGSVIQAGTGALVLNGADTYSGTTAVEQGSLVAGTSSGLTGSGAFGTATSAITLGATNITGAGLTGAAGVYTGTGGVTIARSITEIATNGTGTYVTNSSLAIGGLQTSGSSTYTGAITMQSALTGTFVESPALTLTSAAGGTVVFNDVISGANSIIIGGGGKVALTGTSTFSGGSITIQGGSTLNASNTTSNGNLGASGNVLIFNNGIFQYSSGSVFDLSARTVGFYSGGGTIDTNGNNETFANAIGNGGTGSYTGGLTLADSNATPGSLTLTAANNYSGATTVTSGTLITSGAGTLGGGSSGLAVNTNGNLDLHGTSQNVGNLSGNGGLIYNNLSGTSTLTVGNGNTGGGSFAGVIENSTNSTGTMALTKSGTGTISLTGSNTYTGATTVNGGALNIGSGASLGATAVTVNGGALSIGTSGSTTATVIGNLNGGSLTINSGGALTFTSGIVGGSDTAIKNLDLNGSGGTALTITGGTLNIGLGGGTADQVIVGSGLGTSLSGAITINLNVLSTLSTGSIELISYGSGGTNSNSATYSIVDAGGVSTSGDSFSIASTSSGLYLDVSATSFAYWKGAGLSWSTISNFTTDSGGTTPRSAALDNQTSVVFTATGGSNYANTTLDGSPTINNLVFNVAGVGIGNGNSSSNSLTIDGSTGIAVSTGVGSGTETISANVVLGGAQTWTVTNAASTLAVSGNVSGSSTSNLIKAGSGTLVLSGVNTYSGATTVSGGYLNIQSSDALDGTSTVTVSSGAALQMQGGVTTNNSTSLTINGTGPGTAGALESVTDGNSYTGAILLGSASSIGSDTGNFSLTGSTITNGGNTLTLVGAGNGYISDVISGTGGVTMNGTGMWSLDAVNTYTGTTTVNSGTLQLGAATYDVYPPTFGAGTNGLAVNGGTVDLNAWNLTVGNLTGASGTITNSLAQEVVFTLGTNTNSSFGGSIVNGASGAGIIDLVKQGSGTQTLTGTNSYTGSTTISGGALNIAGANALSSSTAVTVGTGGALQLSGNISTAAASLGLSGTGSGNGALENVSGTNTYTGSVSLAGNASIGADALSSLTLSTGTVAMNASNLTLVGAGTGTISDTISGSGNLAENGTGTWTLSGSNSYTGTTSVAAGTLVYTKSSALRNSAAITLGGTTGATLDYAGTSATMTTPMTFLGTNTVTLGNTGTGSVTYSGSLTFAGGASTLVLGNATDTIGGAIGGNITNGTGVTSLVKQGALNSTWILTGSNTYTGQTTITGGVLQVSSVPTGNIDLNGTSISDYGVLQVVGTETLTNTLGTGAGQIQWLSNGGFSAVSGTMTLDFAGGQTLVWGVGGATNIGGPGGGNIAFGSSTANGVIILQNSINLNSSNDSYTQNVYVQGDTVFFQGAILNGTDSVATGTYNASPGLNKIGSGTLVLTNASSNYRGPTSIVGGTLVAEASSTITLANSTGSSTGVFGNGFGPITSNTTGTATYVNIILGQDVIAGGASTTGGVINPTLLVGSPTIGGSTSISNPVTVDWNNGTGQVYGIGGYTDSNNTFAGLISLTNPVAATGNTFAVTQVATTGSDALNITGGINMAGTTGTSTGTINFANVGAVNVSSTGITNGTGSLSVAQTGTGTTTFSAANTYTGATTVSGGLLRINGSLTASPVTVNGGALGGTGTISGAVTVNAGGSINLADGTIGTLTVGSLTLGTGSTAMTFDIGAGATNNLDSIADLGALTINGGTSAITIGFVSGSPLLTAGTYTLISANVSSVFGDFSLTDSQLGNYALKLVNGGASGLELQVTSNIAPTTYFYTGTVSTDFTNYQNFNTDATSGTQQTASLTLTSDVTIGTTSPTPANLTPVANSNMTIDSLTFASSGSGATLSGTGTITIAASGNNGIGIADNAGIPTGTETISTAIVLGGQTASQTWSTTANSTLKVTGAISGSQSLALTGAGTYRLGGANTFSGLTVGTGSDTPSVYLANGTNGSATGTTTFTVKAGATIGGKGTSSGTSFTLAGTGTATSARVNVLAGLISATDTNTTGVLTLKGSAGTSSIADANLTFNLDAKSTSSTQINVGGTNVAFGTDSVGSVKLTLNVQNEPAIIAAYTPYTLIAGTGSTSITPGSSTGQYTGLTLGATTNLAGGVTETVITGNNLQLAFGSSLDSNYYANGSYLVLYQSAGVDDIDVVVVPEPGTWAMMLGGLAALFFWQRRRSKA